MTFFRIEPAFIKVNYVFPSIFPHHSLVKIAYSENVKGLLEAILADIESKGYSVSKKDYVVLKTSIDIYTDLSSRIPAAEAQELLKPQPLLDVFEEVPKRESQKLFEVFDKVPSHKYVHVIVKPRFSGMDFIFARINLFICFRKNREVFAQ